MFCRPMADACGCLSLLARSSVQLHVFSGSWRTKCASRLEGRLSSSPLKPSYELRPGVRCTARSNGFMQSDSADVTKYLVLRATCLCQRHQFCAAPFFCSPSLYLLLPSTVCVWLGCVPEQHVCAQKNFSCNFGSSCFTKSRTAVNVPVNMLHGSGVVAVILKPNFSGLVCSSGCILSI